MSLRIIFGRAGSGKTRFCLEELVKADFSIPFGKKSPLILLVPEQYTLQAEKELIRVSGKGGIIGMEVLSFRRLAYRIFNEMGGITYPHVHSSGKCILLYRILGKIKNDLNVFAGAGSKPGFIGSLSKLITEMKRYEITPAMLLSASGSSENLPSPDNLESPQSLANSECSDNSESLALATSSAHLAHPAGSAHPASSASSAHSMRSTSSDPTADELKMKLKELSIIYSIYEEEISAKYRDPDDNLSMAASKLEKSDMYNGTTFWVDGFSGFTLQELNLLKVLFTKATRVNISLCTDYLVDPGSDPETDVFASVKDAYAKLVKIASDAGVPVEKPVKLAPEIFPRFSESPVLAHLEKNLYELPGRIFKGEIANINRQLKLLAASGKRSETEAVARDIIRLCRDCNYRYRDIAVVARNLEDYRHIVEIVFKEHEIPFFLDLKEALTEQPAVRFVLSLLDIFTENWTYEPVFRYLKTGFTEIENNEIDLLENYVLSCGIKGSIWMQKKDWKMKPDMIPGQEFVTKIESECKCESKCGAKGETEQQTREIKRLETINDIRKRVAAPLSVFYDKIKGRHKVTIICTAIYDFLITVRNIENDTKAWNIIIELLEQISEVMSDEELTIKEFSDILKIGIKEYSIGTIPESLDQVLVGSVERSKSHQIKALYIIGVNDGVFPAPVMEEGILSDNDRKILKESGIELAGDARIRTFNEQFLIYRTLTAPGCMLTLSWPATPSIIISRIRRIFPALRITYIDAKDTDDEIILLAAKLPAFRRMVSNLRLLMDGQDIDYIWCEVFYHFRSLPEWRERCENIIKALNYNNKAGNISSESARMLYGDPMIASVSRIERFSACPFSYFIQYGLKAEDRKIFSLNPPDIGTFLHRAIERFSRLLLEKGISYRDVDKEWAKAAVNEVIDNMLKEMEGYGISASKRYTALASRLRRVVARTVSIISEHISRGDFEPVGVEIGFGGGSGIYPYVDMELKNGSRVRLTGRVDRLDTLVMDEGEVIRVIDYKSGVKKFALSDVFYGLNIQLPVYLDSIIKSTKNKKIIPGGILYLKIDDPIISVPRSMTDEEVDSKIIKQLKMRGLVIDDPNIILKMDNNISGYSDILPVSIKKDGSLGRSSVASRKQFDIMSDYLEGVIKEVCSDMLNGNVAIRPYKMKNKTSCDYCLYLPICRFESKIGGNDWNILRNLSDQQCWTLMGKGLEKNE